MNKNAATLSGQFDIAQSQARCRWVRRRILSMSRNVAALHMGGAFSCAEILDCVYFGLMRKSSEGKFQDSFILSKGHAGITLYATLEEMKILSPEDLDAYCTPQGRLGAHPDRGLPGIEASTGSLGHGLGMGCGMALHD
ncbi:MAG TPA: transketolase, partial [Magnetococcales bacterium]|nr:transketolase [Magnetococcales bacterium]